MDKVLNMCERFLHFFCQFYDSPLSWEGKCDIIQAFRLTGETPYERMPRSMSDTALHPAVTLRLYTDRKCFGPGVAMLLQRVRKLHSLRSAAMDMDMAYSKAWTILRDAEQELGFKLLHSTTGGRGGGGAVLTERGERLLEAYETCEQALKEEAERLFDRHLAVFAAAGSREQEEEL